MRHLFCVLPFLLAGCDNASVTTADVRGGNASTPAGPVNVPPSVAAEARGERVSGFPTAFLGRWSMVTADCRGDAAAKGLMTIDAKTVRLYEARGVTPGLKVQSPTKVSGTFDFDGEGQRWRNEQTFELAQGGTSLVRTEGGSGSSFTYQKCD